MVYTFISIFKKRKNIYLFSFRPPWFHWTLAVLMNIKFKKIFTSNGLHRNMLMLFLQIGKEIFNKCKKELSQTYKSNFLITISLEPDGANNGSFRLFVL